MVLLVSVELSELPDVSDALVDPPAEELPPEELPPDVLPPDVLPYPLCANATPLPSAETRTAIKSFFITSSVVNAE